jgi:type 1 glutamine amidotransferase
MADSTRVLVVTKGHPFEAEPFFAVFDALGLDWDHIEHPEAQQVLNAEGTADYDALVMYDMPGLAFTRSDTGPPVVFDEPSAEFRRGYDELLEAGRGLVFLHHSIASWPSWPRFAEVVGGRFHYQPGTFDGHDWPDSGYAFDVTHTVEVLEPDHPICAGLAPRFEITDELYLFPTVAPDPVAGLVPLIRSTFDFVDRNFYSADRAIRGDRNSRAGWSHPPGSDLVAWVKHAGRSPLAYVQFADGPVTYADENFRRVLSNAIGWAASDEAHDWARRRSAL